MFVYVIALLLLWMVHKIRDYKRSEKNKMAVPKKKTSKSKRNMRRSHHRLTDPVYAEDKNTGEFVRPHHVCLKTGMYNGKQILDVA